MREIEGGNYGCHLRIVPMKSVLFILIQFLKMMASSHAIQPPGKLTT